MSWAGWLVWNSIPDSDRALPKYKFKNTLQSRPLDILIQEDTYIGVRTLFDSLVNIKFLFKFHSYLVSFTCFEIYVFSVLLI